MTLTFDNTETKETDTSLETQEPAPLSGHVQKAVDFYFAQLNGHEATGLHAMVIQEVEKPLIETTLKHTGHNQSKAAKALGLSRSTLRKKMALYNISA